jgi:Uma2 family endonuclease
MQSIETTFNLRLWTVEEYRRMALTGILDSSERVELIEGKIIRMSAKGTAHRSAVGRTDYLFKEALKNRAWVSVQDPIALNANSEPEPDIAVVKIDPLDYADHHPTPEEVYLIIEVADSSLKFDCDTKGKAYAKAGIADYWVLDVIDRELYVYRQPTLEGYKSKTVLNEDKTISPLKFPELQVNIRDMLPPTS